jgi:hypothetical protein
MKRKKVIYKTLYVVGGKRRVRSTTTAWEGGVVHVDRLIMPLGVKHETEIIEREDTDE